MFLNYAKFHSNQEIASTYYDRHHQNVGTLLLISKVFPRLLIHSFNI